MLVYIMGRSTALAQDRKCVGEMVRLAVLGGTPKVCVCGAREVLSSVLDCRVIGVLGAC